MGAGELGNKPLSELNDPEWKGIVPIVNDQSRVCQSWVNGYESFYYTEATTQLNAALAKFAIVEAKSHVVVLSPGPAEQRSLLDKNPIPFNWNLQIIGGIANSREKDINEDPELKNIGRLVKPSDK